MQTAFTLTQWRWQCDRLESRSTAWVMPISSKDEQLYIGRIVNHGLQRWYLFGFDSKRMLLFCLFHVKRSFGWRQWWFQTFQTLLQAPPPVSFQWTGMEGRHRSLANKLRTVPNDLHPSWRGHQSAIRVNHARFVGSPRKTYCNASSHVDLCKMTCGLGPVNRQQAAQSFSRLSRRIFLS